MSTTTRKRIVIAAASIALVSAAGWLGVQYFLSGAFSPGPTEGPFAADGVCPEFRAEYPQCEVLFGNRGLSTLNSFYETFVGEGAFEIDGFRVETLDERRFDIIAESNRGPIRSEIFTDRLVRLGQDRENERVHRTHQSAFCDDGRIYEHQVGYMDGSPYVQDLEFWSEDDALHFRLFQDGSPTAEVVCR